MSYVQEEALLTGKCSGLVGLAVGVHFVCIPQGGSQQLQTRGSGTEGGDGGGGQGLLVDATAVGGCNKRGGGGGGWGSNAEAEMVCAVSSIAIAVFFRRS